MWAYISFLGRLLHCFWSFSKSQGSLSFTTTTREFFGARGQVEFWDCSIIVVSSENAPESYVIVYLTFDIRSLTQFVFISFVCNL